MQSISLYLLSFLPSPRFVSDPETDNRSVRSRLHFWGKVFASSLPSRSLPFSASHACTLCKCSRRSEGTGKKEGIANFRASNIQCRFDARRQRRSPCLDSDPLLRMRSNDESDARPSSPIDQTKLRNSKSANFLQFPVAAPYIASRRIS